ncbi:three-helix bundle dimerization domain-containing protein [Planotetraspora sp. GP83]|uniref:three-helix bundle dimerization domain-containing protein n=1 Tax=Planotetraspora sp. GP83 TaxID=3156264 RepID=UPI003515F41A
MCANALQIALPPAIEELTDRLKVSYADLLTATVVEGVVRDCYQPFKYVRITSYVPMFVEHDSRIRLRQLTECHVRTSPPAPSREMSGGRRSRSFMTALRSLRARLTRST